MPLKIVEITDLRDFTRNFVTNRGLPNMDPHNQDLSEGINLGNGDGASSGSEYVYGSYFHNADLYFWIQAFDKNDSATGSRTVRSAFYAHDALCRDDNVGWWIPDTYQPTFASINGMSFHFGGTNKRRVLPGQPNLTTGAQLFYYHGDLSGVINSSPESYVVGWHSFNAADGSRDQFFVNAWPNVDDQLNSHAAGAIDGTTAGYWDSNRGVNGNQDEYYAMVFEGITDTTGGMPGETGANKTGIYRGGTSHPKGLMLIRTRHSNLDGSGTSNDTGMRWTWVDIDTGLAVGYLGLVVNANNFSNNTFAGPSLDFREFEWQGIQFVPDPGSSFSQPKGELHLFLSEDSRFELPDRTIEVADETPFTSTINRQYVAVYDFNPFNDVSGKVRIHNRRTFIGILDTPCEPIIAGGGDSIQFGTTHERRSPHVYYHPGSRSWCNVQALFFDANNRGADEPQVGYSRICRWARQTEVDIVTHPIVLEPVREDDLITVRMKVTNDFGDPIAGETIHFRTTRSSTRDEQFNGTTQGATNYVVSQGVIDDDYSLQVYEGGGIDSGGTLLVEGVDYTVSSYATGTLAPVTSWPTDTVSVRYRHRSSVVTPGWGTLYAGSAVSNADGVVSTLIELPANLEGELIGIEADSEGF